MRFGRFALLSRLPELTFKGGPFTLITTIMSMTEIITYVSSTGMTSTHFIPGVWPIITTTAQAPIVKLSA